MNTTVQQLWRYPAKSMLGQTVDRVEIVPLGVVGDRMWAVHDDVRGGIRGAKKIPGLMRIGARYLFEPDGSLPPPPIELTLPDGTITVSDHDDANRRLSDALGHAVTLAPLQPASNTDHYRRGAPDSDDLLTELRDMFGRTEDEPLPDLSSMPEVIFEHESPPGTYYDVYPIHLMTTASLAKLAALAPDSAVDVRRFRPSIVIDAGDRDTGDTAPSWLEQDWVGRRLHLGSVELAVAAPCPRCVMTTRAVAELDADREVLRRIVRDADQNLGIYATVVQPGEIKIGDEVRIE